MRHYEHRYEHNIIACRAIRPEDFISLSGTYFYFYDRIKQVFRAGKRGFDSILA